MGAGGSTGLCRRRHLTGSLGNREEEVVTTLGSHDLGAVSPSHLVEGGGATEHLFWRMGPHEPGREGVGVLRDVAVKLWPARMDRQAR